MPRRARIAVLAAVISLLAALPAGAEDAAGAQCPSDASVGGPRQARPSLDVLGSAGHQVPVIISDVTDRSSDPTQGTGAMHTASFAVGPDGRVLSRVNGVPDPYGHADFMQTQGAAPHPVVTSMGAVCVRIQVMVNDAYTGAVVGRNVLVGQLTRGAKENPVNRFAQDGAGAGRGVNGWLSYEIRQRSDAPEAAPAAETYTTSYSGHNYETTPGWYGGTLFLLDSRTARVLVRRDVKPSRGPGPVSLFSGTGRDATWIAFGRSRNRSDGSVLTTVEGWRGTSLVWRREVPLLEHPAEVWDTDAGPVIVTQAGDGSDVTAGQVTDPSQGARYRKTLLDRDTGLVLSSVEASTTYEHAITSPPGPRSVSGDLDGDGVDERIAVTNLQVASRLTVTSGRTGEELWSAVLTPQMPESPTMGQVVWRVTQSRATGRRELFVWDPDSQVVTSFDGPTGTQLYRTYLTAPA